MNLTVKINKMEVYTVPESRQEGANITPHFVTGDTPEFGKHWPEQGGVLAGIMPAQDNHPAYYLIVPTDPAAEAEGLVWGEYGESIDGLSVRDGKFNTDLLSTCNEKFPAADFCSDLSIDDFNDFYLPSRREASLMAATVPHLFKSGWHWTSTQYSAHTAFFQDFEGGDQTSRHKDITLRVRAVRRFIIN